MCTIISIMIRKTLTTLFADMQGYTSRTGRQTREQHEKFIIELRSFIEKQTKENNGHFVKAMGDGFMLTFESPTDAVACGMSIQKQIFLRYTSFRKREKPILFRIGISTGEVMVDEGGDVYGEAVNIAARIEAFCTPGEVYISETTYLAMNKSEFNGIDLGPQKFKNIPREVKVYRVYEGSADVISSLQKPIKKEIIYMIIGIVSVIMLSSLIVFIAQKESSQKDNAGNSNINAQFEQMLKDKDYDGVVRKAQKILDQDPGRGEVYAFLGNAFLQMRDMQRAETYLRKAIEFEPENPSVYHMFSDIYAEKQNFSQAINYLAEYLRREKDQDKMDSAIQRMKELENLKKEYSATIEQESEIESTYGTMEPVEPVEPEQVKAPPQEAEEPAAEKDIKSKYAKKKPPKPRSSGYRKKKLNIMSRQELQNLRNQLKEYMLNKDYDTARALLANAEKENTDNPSFFMFASQLYLKMDDYAKAEQMIQNAIDINPDHPAPYFGLSLVYEEMGRYEDAIRMLEQVLFRDDNEIRNQKVKEKIELIRDKMEREKSKSK